ncbi:MAG: pyridoxamine 5'-phosphate oxidase family protein [Pseudomonadota bacterium]
MTDLITAFPLGFVGSVTADGAPAVSPKGTFLVLDDTTVAYGDIRSPGTRRNLTSDPRVEVNFIDPFRRKAVRVAGTATVHRRNTDWFTAHHPRWLTTFGELANRITALIAIDLSTASEIWTPPYDDGVTEGEMIALYKAKFGAMFA